MISLFSRMNEIEKKTLCECIFKASICFETNIASLVSETDPVDSNYNKFVRKFELDFPKADDGEMKNFIRISFTPDFNKKRPRQGNIYFLS